MDKFNPNKEYNRLVSNMEIMSEMDLSIADIVKARINVGTSGGMQLNGMPVKVYENPMHKDNVY